MAVAFFDVHDGMMPDGELSLIFMIVFIGVFLTGPGRYSVDYLIDRAVKKDKKAEGDDIYIVLPKNIGSCTVEKMPVADFKKMF